MEFSYLMLDYPIIFTSSSNFIDFVDKNIYNFIHIREAYMKKIDILELAPGMIVAEDIYSYNNQLVLQKNTVLTNHSIAKLEFYSVLSLYIEDPMNETPPLAVDTSYMQKVHNSKEYKIFKAQFDQHIISLKSNLNDIIEKSIPIDTSALLADTLALMQQDGKPINTFDMLHSMRHYDDLTFVHSVNVALLCNVFAKWLHFSPADIETATLCGLFHDIGKIKMPDSIIKKPAKLTSNEYDIIKTHTLEGYEILKNHNINLHIQNAALMHHEKCDGSGYPYALFASDIDIFAKMVSIVDVYDAMTCARVYRGPLCPFEVIGIFESEGLQKYDAHYILTFLENIAYTYMQNTVRLSNGMEGKVIFLNRSRLSRPTIQCGERYIDLSAESDITIEAII